MRSCSSKLYRYQSRQSAPLVKMITPQSLHTISLIRDFVPAGDTINAPHSRRKSCSPARMPSWPALHLSPYRHPSFVPPATSEQSAYSAKKYTDVEAKPEVSVDEVDDTWFDAESRQSRSSLGLLPHGRLLSPRQVTMFSMAGSIGTNVRTHYRARVQRFLRSRSSSTPATASSRRAPCPC